jgi:hypothetical protein
VGAGDWSTNDSDRPGERVRAGVDVEKDKLGTDSGAFRLAKGTERSSSDDLVNVTIRSIGPVCEKLTILKLPTILFPSNP